MVYTPCFLTESNLKMKTLCWHDVFIFFIWNQIKKEIDIVFTQQYRIKPGKIVISLT